MRQVQISAFAQNATCPSCSRRMVWNDVNVTTKYTGLSLETCGKVVIGPGARLALRSIKAGAGIEVHGTMECNAQSAGPVTIAPGATWNGDLVAPSVHVAPGARITGGVFRIVPLPDAKENARGNIPA